MNAIAHRGPDESGISTEDAVSLGHRRLSIIDLAAGKQPMCSDDGMIWVSFNGEIFNYVELRQDLIARGYRFRTNSDTEVILRQYEAMGPACVESFNGDFAFALWDRRKGQLLLARDRMGVRPLYYATRGDALYFASEIKALLKVPGIDAELDPIALDQIFTFWFPLGARTPFKGVSQLPPGHILIANSDGMTIRPYWQLDYPDAGESDHRSESAIRDELTELLMDATRIRLRSDVPVGAYLSGGLDSAIVAAFTKHVAPGRLRTFSVTFESREFDESAFQQEMVRALGTEHSAIEVRGEDIAAAFPDVIRATETPILRAGPAPLFHLAGLVREHGYKVVLTGEGADEVFAGYDIFKEAKVRRFHARDPASKFRPLLFKRLYPYLPNIQNQPHTSLAQWFKALPGDASDPLFSHLPRFRSAAGGKVMFSNDLRAQLAGYDALAELRESLPERFARWHPLSQAQYLECAHLLPSYILSSQGDRVAMAHAVEGRFPYLDHRVVEFACGIPPRLKLRGLREKHILRESAASHLPPAIGQRVKQPYRAPDAESFTGPAGRAICAEHLSSAAIGKAGYFHEGGVGKLVAKCLAGAAISNRDNMTFVGVLSTQLWSSIFGKKNGEPGAVSGV